MSNKRKQQAHSYGWVYYRSLEPKSSIVNLDGEKEYETLRIYNATAKPLQVSISIKGKKYVFVPQAPEPDPEPELVPGVHVLVDLTEAEIDHFIKQELESPAFLKTKPSRQAKRSLERDRRKYYARISVVKTIEEPTKEEGGEYAND